MAAKYCAQCGTPLTTKWESGRERPACPACGYIVYRNPVPVALVLVRQDDQLLLLLRKHPPLANYWAPPAGYIEFDESLEEGAAREVKEETGLDVQIDRLSRVYSRAQAGVFMISFEAHVTGGELVVAEDEVLEARWFSRDELPRQAPPADGTLLDNLFVQVLEDVYESVRSSHA